MQECVKGVYDFNNMCNNFDSVDYKKLLAQARVVKEEGEELFTAFLAHEGNAQVLKETVDVLVTITGMVGMLESIGYDVVGAWKVVNENNMTKACDLVTAQYSKHFFEETTPVEIEYNTQFDKYLLRDALGKIRKPYNYQKVDVSMFCPKGA